jgi:hypothetical protein
MANGIYQRLFANLMNKVVDLEADIIKIALMDNVHAFDGTDNVWGDVSANEIAGTGYTAGGETLANKAVTQGAITKWDADNVQWNDATVDFYHAVLYDNSVSDNLIASIDFGGSQSLTDGIVVIQWDTDGIITLSE